MEIFLFSNHEYSQTVKLLIIFTWMCVTGYLDWGKFLTREKLFFALHLFFKYVHKKNEVLSFIKFFLFLFFLFQVQRKSFFSIGLPINWRTIFISSISSITSNTNIPSIWYYIFSAFFISDYVSSYIVYFYCIFLLYSLHLRRARTCSRNM